MIRDNTEIQKLDPKKLNKQFPLENYKFTSRNGILVIYSTKAELNKQTVTQRQNKLDDSFDEFRSEMNEMNKSITNELNGLNGCLTCQFQYIMTKSIMPNQF